MITLSCGDHGWRGVVTLIVFLLLEYWIGKTRHIKSNSTLELFFAMIGLMFTLLISLFFTKRANQDERK